MSLSISDLFSAQTSDQIRASMVTNLVALGVPADKWRAGGVASTILTVASIAISFLSGVIASLIQGFFLPTATGTDLKVLAKYVYGVTVPDATFASGTLTLTNSGGATYTFGVGEYTAQNPTTKTTYTNNTAFTLSPGGTATPTMIATVAGSAGNAAAHAITTSVTTLISVSVDNAAAFVGVDAPSDEAIRTLCLNKLGALSVRGVRTAYAYAIQVATNAVTGAPVNINRWSITSASHTGVVTVLLASPSGAPDANDVAGVVTSIEALARPEAVTVNVSGATTVADSDTITIWCQAPSGVNAAQIKTAIDAALIKFISEYPIGAQLSSTSSPPLSSLYASGVYGEIGAAVASLGGTLITATGATDIALSSSQVATNSVTTIVRVLAPTSGTTAV